MYLFLFESSTAGLKRGESIFRQKKNLVVCAWQDKRQVYVMSTNCQATGTSTVRRKQKDGSISHVPCPPSVVLYNKFMGGVDHHDQFRSYYKLRSKSKKFYTYIFWFLLDVCTINAFLLMRHFGASTHSKLSQIKHFRVKLAEGLIGSYNSRQKYSLPAKVREVAKQPGCKPPSYSQARDPTRVASSSLQVGQGHFPVKGKVSQMLLLLELSGKPSTWVNYVLPSLWPSFLCCSSRYRKWTHLLWDLSLQVPSLTFPLLTNQLSSLISSINFHKRSYTCKCMCILTELTCIFVFPGSCFIQLPWLRHQNKVHLLISLIHNTCQYKNSLVSLLESKIQKLLKTYTWTWIPVVTQCHVQLRNTVGKGLSPFLLLGVGSGYETMPELAIAWLNV